MFVDPTELIDPGFERPQDAVHERALALHDLGDVQAERLRQRDQDKEVDRDL
jgi:hypothetical protein